MFKARTLAIQTVLCLAVVQVVGAEPPVSREEAQRAFSMGQSKLRAGDLEGARSDFERATSGAPDEHQYLSALGLVYLRMNEGHLAERTYARLCSMTEETYGGRSPRLFGCHSLWGNALMVNRDFRSAEEKFRSAYEIAFAQDPRSAEDCLIALYWIAQALSQTGRLSETVPLYEQLLASTSPVNRRFPEVEDALRRVRSGSMPLRLLR